MRKKLRGTFKPRRYGALKTYRLDQLDEEVRIALGLRKRPGVSSVEGEMPFVHGEFTAAQQAAISATFSAHVADPLWDEKPRDRITRVVGSDADLDAYLAGAPTQQDTVAAVRTLVRAVRALAKIARGES